MFSATRSPGQQHVGVTLQRSENGSLFDLVAFAEGRLDLRDLGVEMKEDRLGHLEPADHEIFLREKSSHPADVRSDGRLRRYVAASDVLREKIADRRKHFAVVEPVHVYLIGASMIIGCEE